MNPVKIIFFDIDGTLIDIEHKKISERTLEALRRLQQNNILICLATGRGPVTLPHFDGITFDAFLTFNGSYCFNSQQTIFSNPIPTEDVKIFVRNAASIGRPVSIATKENFYANGKDQDLIDYFAVPKLEVNVSEKFDDVLEHEDVYQLLLGCRSEDYPLLLNQVHGAKITAWWDRAADVIPADGGKGQGIAKILEYYHLDRSQAMAFGDGNNDIEMLQAVGQGIAMKNASTDLKAVADDICGSAAEDGIYHYCVEHKLI